MCVHVCMYVLYVLRINELRRRPSKSWLVGSDEIIHSKDTRSLNKQKTLYEPE